MRFRPLRSSTVPETPSLVVTDPPSLMKAVVYDAPGTADVLRLAEVAVPAPVLSELLVRVVAAGVNPIDAKTRSGGGATAGIPSYPSTLGFDFSGVVVKAPYESHPLAPGTEVYGMVPFPRSGGTYAEYVVVPSLSVARKPASLSHAEAAGVPLAALTAWGLVVETAHAHEGQRILIHAGSGGVGHFAVQLASYFGAHVTATGSAANLPWLRELGASVAIDYATTRFEDVVSDVDVVIDLVGNVHDDTGSRSLSVLRRGGLYVLVPTGGWPGYAEAAAAAGLRATSYKVIPDGGVLSTLGRLLESGSIRVFLDRVFDLGEAAAAHRELERGHTRGKSVLQVSDD
ncbi:NADP-dependent oxidoreductase [Microbacterium sp. zg.Y1090]|uniref:NADP-dependent oxidoreductase n=1 Tax=Microbacterium TaxID=33882 RepID=UPI00214C8032|nr:MULTISPECIES: NADP-dependent oxidoreductase [unclassified Microbacterium]MCR2812619.1 NADP-dependent oxidoreductase [Microbacterium sp. zg.Y1084]MCR2817585.1 NADP-dependent oxidoreductase [Microbacterium sp. zg.Y1090]MDL5485772.1 NADP-dependent oxidoreductase [Microbacterium sp. zg-Y1211]WIM28937.1 NADP-dependent oxidoreductase [Microbacterium sp. zg-Y1090]